MTSVTSTPQAPTASSSSTSVSSCKRDKCLRGFAKYLSASTKNSASVKKNSSAGVVAPALGSSSKVLQKYLVHDPSDPSGGATCSMPSFDLYSGQVAGLHLPSLGESAKSNVNPLASASGGAPKSPQFKIPTMSAAIYSAQGNDAIRKPSEDQTANTNAVMLEQAAAHNLGSTTTWTRSTVHLAPMTMLKSLSASFSALVDARVRAWMLLFLRQSLSSGDQQSRAHLLKLLATSQSIDIKSVATSFNALTLPSTFSEGGGENEVKPPSEIILPLLFEVVSNVVLHEEKVVAKLRAPGTLLGVFGNDNDSSLMTAVNINLDTKALVASMVEQARLVVFKAVASATSLPLGRPSRQPPLQQQQQLQRPTQQQQPHPKKIVSIGATALTSTPEDESQETKPGTLLPDGGAKMKPLHKPKSVLKMTSRGLATPSTNVLTKSDNAPSLMPKKSRSITWSHSVSSVDVSKADRFKMMFAPSLKSSKSFGRPDANTFETSRNATFADFGRSVNQAAQHTFVNGKLKMNTNAYSMANLTASSSKNEDFVLKRNAEFSDASVSMTSSLNNRRMGNVLSGMAKSASAFERAPKGVAAGRNSLSRSTPSKETENIPQPMLPRTPTALEGLLLQKSQARQF